MPSLCVPPLPLPSSGVAIPSPSQPSVWAPPVSPLPVSSAAALSLLPPPLRPSTPSVLRTPSPPARPPPAPAVTHIASSTSTRSSAPSSCTPSASRSAGDDRSAGKPAATKCSWHAPTATASDGSSSSACSAGSLHTRALASPGATTTPAVVGRNADRRASRATICGSSAKNSCSWPGSGMQRSQKFVQKSSGDGEGGGGSSPPLAVASAPGGDGDGCGGSGNLRICCSAATKSVGTRCRSILFHAQPSVTASRDAGTTKSAVAAKKIGAS
eukprot:365710-Chlamydomonas_euryale.AAC.6